VVVGVFEDMVDTLSAFQSLLPDYFAGIRYLHDVSAYRSEG